METQKSYVKLKRITPVEVANTYDVTVQDKHKLIANGFYTSNCWHPDIVEFITAKQQSGRLTKFNLSVNCTDEFMSRVENIRYLEEEIERMKADPNPIQITIDMQQKQIDELNKWDLIFPDTTHEEYREKWNGDIKMWKKAGLPVIVHSTVSTKWLWNLVMESTYNRAEPGILFLDRANDYNPLYYGETIYATNPCLTGDSIVWTDKGHITLIDLCTRYKNGEHIRVMTYNTTSKALEWEDAVFADKTREKANIISLELDDGTVLKLTPDHPVYTENRGYIKASQLTGEDVLIITA